MRSMPACWQPRAGAALTRARVAGRSPATRLSVHVVRRPLGSPLERLFRILSRRATGQSKGSPVDSMSSCHYAVPRRAQPRAAVGADGSSATWMPRRGPTGHTRIAHAEDPPRRHVVRRRSSGASDSTAARASRRPGEDAGRSAVGRVPRGPRRYECSRRRSCLDQRSVPGVARAAGQWLASRHAFA